ncbi:MAG: threonylcarbamoyl-AMP synthase, partial [candidate division NC10 bacterium]|nr:threonylcarbamoyl-AMP synthase [candidate division NC10 bacterium]
MEDAARSLGAGRLVVFPTDTLYALGADPRNLGALERLLTAKGGRDRAIPLLLAGLDALQSVVAEVPDVAVVLAERFWPGALTLILRARPDLPEAVTGGTGTVGVRVPAGPVATALLRKVGAPVTGTSANRTDERAPRRADEVGADLLSHVDLVLDGGACPLGVPSTLLDLTVDPPRVRRPGAVPVGPLRTVQGL